MKVGVFKIPQSSPDDLMSGLRRLIKRQQPIHKPFADADAPAVQRPLEHSSLARA